MVEHNPTVCFPILPRCSTYEGRTRCHETATVYLYAPDGQPNPGGYLCQAHGEAVVSEYREKLGETWTLQPIHRYSSACGDGSPCAKPPRGRGGRK